MTKKLIVELTNRCTLACPACPRTTWKELTKIPVPKADLDIDEFQKFMDCPGGNEIDCFILSGDFGDPIYYPRLFEFLETFRSNKEFYIHTNGSHQTKDFWVKLSKLLSKDDKIIFGIDGLEDTNHLYRKNANWTSIMSGIDIITQSPAEIFWQTIIFSFNYKNLGEIKKFAESKNTKFFTLNTHRFGDNSLIPPDNFIEKELLFKDDYNTNHNIIIEPKCNYVKTIACDGYFYPCDWIRNPRTLYKSQLWKQKSRWLDQLKIANTNYDQANIIINDWVNYVRESSKEGLPTVDVLCRMKCRKGCSQGLDPLFYE